MRRPTIYEFLNNLTTITGEKTIVRPKRIQDAINEYYWRQDEELSRLDASLPVTSTLQEYIHWYADDHGYSNNSCILAVDTLDGKHIGNFGCFNINDIDKEMEIGIVIGEKDYWNQGYGLDVVQTMLKELFDKTWVERIYLKTLNWNTRAQKCFRKCGFIQCAKMMRGEHTFVVMEIRRQKECRNN